MAALLDALPVIVSLIILEGLLSVDNAMLLAAMVKHLPTEGRFNQRQWALRAGLLGAYVLRGLSLFFVAFLIANPWIKLAGAAYLVYLMCEHLGVGDPRKKGKLKKERGFWGTVIAVEIADLAFSVDNVIAAVALSPKLWVVVTGVFIGIAAMRFVAGYFIKLMDKYPILAKVAYLLVGYVGLQLLAEELFHVHTTELVKLGVILAIIALGIIYDRVPLVRTALAPLVRIAERLMGFVAHIVDVVLWPLYWLGDKLTGLLFEGSDEDNRREQK